MTCTPTGDLASPLPHPDRCRCGATIRPVPRGDDWAWEDEHGQTYVSHIAEIHAEWNRCHAVASDPHADMTDPVVMADVMRYSVMSAALALNHANKGHTHSPIGEARHQPPPWCCGQPMQSVPRGWKCRVAKSVVPYADILGGLWAA